jgi:two-component system CheB/CheR fusion protein
MVALNSPRQREHLEHFLAYVEERRAFDFTGYQAGTLSRRITGRVKEVGCESYADYQEYLDGHPEEFGAFFDAILVRATSFFRDPQVWEFVAEEIVPRLVSGKEPDASIRVWSVGCASGEETYTLAMVLCEALGLEQFRTRVTAYGTDVDEEALARARRGWYSAAALEAVPEALRDRYFEPRARGGMFRRDLSESVIFGRHDVVQDAPLSRIDLLVCRNTLMYMDAAARARVLDQFRFAIEERGYLFLGLSDTVLDHSAAFRPLQGGMRVFERTAETAEARRPSPVWFEASATAGPVTSADQPGADFDQSTAELRAAAHQQLEITNEVLKTTIAGLRARNEEHVSAEEHLQSEIDELRMVNEMLTARLDRLDRSEPSDQR